MSSRRRPNPFLIPLVVLALAGTVPLAASADASFSRTGYRILNWEPRFMNATQSVTRSQAVNEAKTFDVIVGLKETYRNYVSAMRAANPNLILLVYLGGGFSQGDPYGTLHPDSWYAHDRYGRKIKLTHFGNYLMNPASSSWVNDVATRCVSYRSFSGYDGCLLDQLGPAPLDPTYVTGLPINPSTGRAWSRAAWLSATSALAATVKQRLGAYYLIPNGILTGSDYFDPAGATRLLTANTDGGMVELFSRAPNTPLTHSRQLAEWRKDVDMLVDAGARGKTLLVVAKAWASGTQANKDALHRYALATFLLGTNGRSYFSFLSDRNTARPSSYWRVDLGSPVSHYSRVASGYGRWFTKGRVLVNPTSTTFTVSLGGQFRTLTGTAVSSITLSPHTAAILTKP